MRSYEQYVEDISQLTNLPRDKVIYLMKLFRLIIGHEIFECMVNDSKKYESYCVGIGKLQVEYNPNTNDYDVISFKLSQDMKKILDEVLDTQKSPIESKLEDSMMESILTRFKEVIDLG